MEEGMPIGFILYQSGEGARPCASFSAVALSRQAIAMPDTGESSPDHHYLRALTADLYTYVEISSKGPLDRVTKFLRTVEYEGWPQT